MGIVTVITSGKGGVGKSTLTACLGVALARRGRRVLMLDMDLGLGSLDHMMGVSKRLIYDLSDVLKGHCEPAKAIYECEPFYHLFLLPAPQLFDESIDKKVLRNLIFELAADFDHVLIDCPAGVGIGFQAAICACDRALVVVNPVPISLRDAKKVRAILQNEGLKDVRLVINRFFRKSFLKACLYEDLDEIIDETGLQLIAVIPEDTDAMVQFAKGIPISRSLALSEAFDRLAARIDGKKVSLPSLKKL